VVSARVWARTARHDHSGCEYDSELTGWLAEHNLALGDLRAGRQTLEDVFLRLTGTGGDPASDPASEGEARR